MRPSIVEFLQGHGLYMLATAVPTRSVVYLLAMAVATLLFLRRSKRVGLSLDLTLPLAAVAAFGTLVGARLYFLLDRGGVMTEGPAAWIENHGQGSWGACIGAAVAGALFLKLKRARPWPALDAAASSVTLAIAIARLGCFLDGCDFGRMTSHSWGVHYPETSAVFRAQVSEGLLSPEAAQSLAVHPLPLYLAVNALVLFVILSLVWRRWAHRPGLTFALTCALYGSTRFFLEILRDPAAGGAVSGLSVLQWTAVGAVGFGAFLVVASFRRAGAVRPQPLATPAA